VNTLIPFGRDAALTVLLVAAVAGTTAQPASARDGGPIDISQTQPATQQDLPDAPMTESEIGAMRQQLAECWTVPTELRGVQNLAVQIRVLFNPDGSVAEAEIVDRARMASDAAYRTAATKAYGAVMSCSPLRDMPPNKHNIWKNVTLTFDPRETVAQ
jgi:hypothetical protein